VTETLAEPPAGGAIVIHGAVIVAAHAVPWYSNEAVTVRDPADASTFNAVGATDTPPTTKRSKSLFASPETRSRAYEPNATNRPSELMAGL
jgi:hypothetical protein